MVENRILPFVDVPGSTAGSSSLSQAVKHTVNAIAIMPNQAFPDGRMFESFFCMFIYCFVIDFVSPSGSLPMGEGGGRGRLFHYILHLNRYISSRKRTIEV